MTCIFISPSRTGVAAAQLCRQVSPKRRLRIHLVVNNLDDTADQIRSAGCHFRNEIIRGFGSKQILQEDPSGNLVELFEPNTQQYRAPGSSSATGDER
jgi:predicted enzyme related to lactoylglutathione lyase